MAFLFKISCMACKPCKQLNTQSKIANKLGTKQCRLPASDYQGAGAFDACGLMRKCASETGRPQQQYAQAWLHRTPARTDMPPCGGHGVRPKKSTNDACPKTEAREHTIATTPTRPGDDSKAANLSSSFLLPNNWCLAVRPNDSEQAHPRYLQAATKPKKATPGHSRRRNTETMHSRRHTHGRRTLTLRLTQSE